MGFVNAVAWIANTEGHHPDLEVAYSKCVVNYTTHAIKGLSENDFICAAKIDRLVGG
jgi:4a-hydroxytetrahydrobiopterin dehydratase